MVSKFDHEKMFLGTLDHRKKKQEGDLARDIKKEVLKYNKGKDYADKVAEFHKVCLYGKTGTPDYFIRLYDKIYFIELKKDGARDTATAQQKRTIEQWQKAGIDCRLIVGRKEAESFINEIKTKAPPVENTKPHTRKSKLPHLRLHRVREDTTNLFSEPTHKR